MKKLFIAFMVLFTMSIGFVSCKEKTAGEKVEDAVEDVGDGIEDAVDELD